MAKLKLFQYAIIFHPTEENAKKGEKSTILKEITTVLAKDEKEVGMRASRELEEKYLDKLDQVEIMIANF